MYGQQTGMYGGGQPSPQGFNRGNPTTNIVWVQGIEGAKAYPLNPNSMAILLDSEIEGRMYIKVSDNIGMTSMRFFNFTEDFNAGNNMMNQQQVLPQVDMSQYVKKEELTALIKEILNEQTISTTTTSTAAANPTTRVVSINGEPVV